MTAVKCSSCGFPIATNGNEGDNVSCPSCGTTGILTKISQVTVPDPLFWGFGGFVAGMILGGALLKLKKRLE